MRGDLMKRIGELEARVKELEKLVSQKDAAHAAREQFLRHELANETASLDAALAMLRVSPDKIEYVIEAVSTMREQGRTRIAMEKGAAAGAVIAATGGDLDSGK